MLVYLVLAGVVTLLFFTSRARHSREPDTRSVRDFYHKTTDALDKSHGASGGQGAEKVIAGHDVDADGDIDADDAILAREMAERLRQAEQKAKDSAKAKGPNRPDSPKDLIGVGSSASGQEKGADEELAKVQDTGETEATAEERAVGAELATIFSKSPGNGPIAARIFEMLLTRPRCSHHLLQVILPVLEAGKGDPAGEVCH